MCVCECMCASGCASVQVWFLLMRERIVGGTASNFIASYKLNSFSGPPW